MDKDWRISKAEELRKQADALEKEAARLLPEKWEVGQKVRYIRTEDWAFSKGGIGYVVKVREEYKNTPAEEYQVFYTWPDIQEAERKGSGWWTTPDDVELVEDNE